MALLGALELRLGQPAKALATLRPLVADANADPIALHNAGRAARSLGRFDEAEGYLRRAAQSAAAVEAQRDLGLMLGGLGRLAEALPLLLSWVESHPGDKEARLAAAACAVELNRPPEAQQLLDGLADDEPRVALLHGKLLLITGEPQAAADLLSAQLKRTVAPAGEDRVSLDMRRVAAEAYLRLANGEAVVGLLRGRTEKDANLALLLARAHFTAGAAAQAAATLQPFIEAIEGPHPPGDLPGDLRAALFFHYGQALLTQDLAARALPYLKQATELSPSDTQAWQNYGQALVLSGQRQAGMAALQRFRQLTLHATSQRELQSTAQAGASDPTARNLAQAAKVAAQGETDRALDLLHQEQTVAPKDPRPWLAEIRLLRQTGQLQRANQVAEQAAKRFPGQLEEFRSALSSDQGR